MIRKTLSVIAVLALLGVVVLGISYFGWRSSAIEHLEQGGTIAETELGPIEYVMKGDTGPVVLFLHGTPGGYDQGVPPDSEFISISPSRPGYLGTPLDVGRTPAEQARAYSALLDTLGIDKVVVAGASGGGPSAISFAAMYPERTIAFIAIEAVSQATDIPALPAFLSSDFLVWLQLSMVDGMSDEEVAELLIPDPENQARALESAEKMQAIRKTIWSLWPPSRRNVGMDNDLKQTAELVLPIHEIKAPALIIHGTADTNVDFSDGQLLADRIEGAEFVVIKDGDHMMPFTHREQVDEAIGAFLRKHALESHGM